MDRRNENCRTAQVPPNVVPNSEEAVRNYEEQGGSITIFPFFGENPLSTLTFTA